MMGQGSIRIGLFGDGEARRVSVNIYDRETRTIVDAHVPAQSGGALILGGNNMPCEVEISRNVGTVVREPCKGCGAPVRHLSYRIRGFGSVSYDRLPVPHVAPCGAPCWRGGVDVPEPDATTAAHEAGKACEACRTAAGASEREVEA